MIIAFFSVIYGENTRLHLRHAHWYLLATGPVSRPKPDAVIGFRNPKFSEFTRE
jgi:hypothetical protein